ncbi:hypothetical protein ADN00_12700 [Ornatilinea apprima]|uniref:Glycosyltransferase RgtA/B/C/D-like domain-containing protein n=1 Tax=Ornatilinea apprima TaxID=1134406 RepID=A0A0P6XKF9_9CHLR|nr:hypothetical protein [Ornatilinea apprima]KPL75502.1 hypothetical protein ADN00_12700 [Ornatilinea apprima]
MDSSPKTILLILILLSAGLFLLFYFPNAAGSENIQMVAVFEPDESVPLPYVFDMIKPTETVKQALIQFAFYEYYFYGFPYFAVSALTLLPLQWLGQLENTPLVMAALRQVVSVLPMLLSILLLVYLQTGFRSYKAVALFLLLVSLPAVMQNNLWWHPDALAILLAMLVIFFLYRDNLRLGWNFTLAGAMCGFSAGTKGIGFYFFLTIAVTLLMALFWKKVELRRVVLAAAGFLLAMAAAYLLANPILIYASVRRDYFHVMSEQSRLLFSGYEIYYEKGLASAWRDLTKHFGSAIFLLAGLSACLWGVARGEKRLLHILILTWVIPTSVMVFSLIHFKFQYWMPVALPLFSCLVEALPGAGWRARLRGQAGAPARAAAWLQGAAALILLAQFGAFSVQNVNRYVDDLHRAESNPSILFYEQAVKALAPLPDEDAYSVYHDVRIYAPRTSGWVTEAAFETLSYQFVEDRDYDVLLLMQQRIADYTNPNAVGIDEEQFAQSRTFYADADADRLRGFNLVYRDEYGLVFVKESYYRGYFAPRP